jgi:hypothetical protein
MDIPDQICVGINARLHNGRIESFALGLPGSSMI